MKSRKWMNELKNEWKEMSLYLATHRKEPGANDQLHEDLKWLKKQLDYYSNREDQEVLTEYFNEVVDKVNEELNISKEKRFKKKKP